MEYRKRLFIWMTFSFLSTFALLSMIQHVDTAPMIRNVKSPKEISDSQGKRLFVPKYMIDLYSLIVDRYGNRRKGVSTIADKIKCFLPGSSSNTSSNSLTYDIRDIAKDESIVKAYLILFKLRQANANNSAGFFRVNIVEGNNRRLAAARLLNRHGGGWKSFELTNAVKRWHKERYNGYTIHIDVKGHQNDIVFTGANKIEQMPFLVVHSKSNNGKVKGKDGTAVNFAAKLPKPDRGLRYKRGSNGHPCKRKSMIVDVNKIGWDRYVIAPRTFDAYRCEGKCRAYSSQAAKTPTNHAVLQAILAQLGAVQDGKPIRPPCCAPSQFENKTLLLHRKVKGQRVIGLEDFTDMVVKSCACL